MLKKILIASSLKPVDDIRTWYKIGNSLRQANKYELKIIGSATKKLPIAQGVCFHIIPGYWLNSLLRLFLPFYYLKNVWQFRPDLQIIASWELLPGAVIYRILKGIPVVYDVQENYRLNIYTLGSESFALRMFKYAIVQIFESLARPFLSEYWLAEHCYSHQLKLPELKIKVFENKALSIKKSSAWEKKNVVLFSGTIGKTQGIFDVIAWWKVNRPKFFPNWTLHIVGHYPNPKNYLLIHQECSDVDSITLQISKSPIPYADIQQSIRNAKIGLLSYPPNAANQEKYPTKLYEYATQGLCIIQLHPNSAWETFLKTHQCGFLWSSIATSKDLDEQIEKILRKEIPPADTLYWSTYDKAIQSRVAYLL